MGWTIGVQFTAGEGIFLFATASRLTLRSNETPIQQVLGVLFLSVKWPRIEDNHSTPSNAKVKNVKTCTSTPMCLHGLVFN